MENCWMSPEGRIYYCGETHGTEAEYIIKRLGFGSDFEECRKAGKCFNEETFLEKKGWIKYCNHPPELGIPIGWVIPDYVKLTQAQRDQLWELTGNFIVDGNLIWPYCVRPYFFIQKNLNNRWESISPGMEGIRPDLSGTVPKIIVLKKEILRNLN